MKNPLFVQLAVFHCVECKTEARIGALNVSNSTRHNMDCTNKECLKPCGMRFSHHTETSTLYTIGFIPGFMPLAMTHIMEAMTFNEAVSLHTASWPASKEALYRSYSGEGKPSAHMVEAAERGLFDDIYNEGSAFKLQTRAEYKDSFNATLKAPVALSWIWNYYCPNCTTKYAENKKPAGFLKIICKCCGITFIASGEK